MLKISLVVLQEDVNEIQRLAYEMEGQKKIIKELIADNASNPAMLESATFKKYNEMYENSSAAFDNAKQGIEEKYIPEAIRNLGDQAEWNLKYSTGVMTIDVKCNKFDKMWEDVLGYFPECADAVEVSVVAAPSNACSCSGDCH